MNLRPSLLRPLRIRITSNRLRWALTLIIWIIAAAWFIYDVQNQNVPFESLLAFLGGFIPLLERAGAKSEEYPYAFDSPQHLQNRSNIIANVHEDYIEGILNQTLPEKVRIELDLRSQPEALQRTMYYWEGQRHIKTFFKNLTFLQVSFMLQCSNPSLISLISAL